MQSAAVTSHGVSAIPMSIAHLISLVSVRARIIAIGVIPVIGLLATGIAYMSGESDVGRAFDSVQRDTALADASRDLKAALLTMRMATADFVAHPSYGQVRSFEDGQQSALQCLDRIEETIGASQRRMITPLRAKVRDLKTSFGNLVHEEEALGFTETDGIGAELTKAGTAIENIIHEDLTWVAQHDADKMLLSLSDHAPLRDRIPAHARACDPEAIRHGSRPFQPAVRFGRRRAVDEGAAEQAGRDTTPTHSRNGSRARRTSSRS